MQLTTGKSRDKSKTAGSGARGSKPENMNSGEGARWSAVQEEIQRIAEATQTGDLSARGHAEFFQGPQKEIVSAVNRMLDARSQQLQLIGSAIKHMSDEHGKGDIDVRIPEEDFRNEFREIAQAV